MMNLPNLTVLNRVFANNSQIAPKSTTNNTVVEHKNFSMAHPQRVSQDSLVGLLDQLSFENLSQESKGVLKGSMKASADSNFHLTAGVLKFKKQPPQNPYPPTDNIPSDPPVNNNPTYPPVNNTPTYPPVDNTPIYNPIEQVTTEVYPAWMNSAEFLF